MHAVRGHFWPRRLFFFFFLRSRQQRKIAIVEHGSRSAVLNGSPVHVPAVSPRELTGTTALKRGIPTWARGVIQILGMVLARSLGGTGRDCGGYRDQSASAR